MNDIISDLQIREALDFLSFRYSCEDYVNSNEALINRINQLGENISEKRLVRLKEIFVNCSHFEAMFWDMAWQGNDGVLLREAPNA